MPMTLDSLQQRALEIKERYHVLNAKEGQKPWDISAYTQGMVGDIGDLMKLIMAKEGLRGGENIEERLSHELGDVLWSLLVMADMLNIDLEKAFHKTMDELDKRLKNKGV
jgi:NTP pyrophosphatase (non-canonical NTP hydrolase)